MKPLIKIVTLIMYGSVDRIKLTNFEVISEDLDEKCLNIW